MGKLVNYLVAIGVLLSACQRRDHDPLQEDNLSTFKSEFLQQISSSNLEEGPFSFNYRFRTVFFSANVISLFGELSVYDRMPHGWQQYEGKTLYKSDDQWKEVMLADLFKTDCQKEFLRIACENSLKDDPLSYFSGNDPLRTTLKHDDIHTFVVDDRHLIIVFQPYSVGGCCDEPFSVKLPLSTVTNQWNASHPFCVLLNKSIESRAFLSSWDKDSFYTGTAEANER